MFTKNPNNKVKFQDQQLDDYVLEVLNILYFLAFIIQKRHDVSLL